MNSLVKQFSQPTRVVGHFHNHPATTAQVGTFCQLNVYYIVQSKTIDAFSPPGDCIAFFQYHESLKAERTPLAQFQLNFSVSCNKGALYLQQQSLVNQFCVTTTMNSKSGLFGELCIHPEQWLSKMYPTSFGTGILFKDPQPQEQYNMALCNSCPTLSFSVCHLSIN